MKCENLDKLSADSDEFGNVVLNYNEGGNLYDANEVDENLDKLKKEIRLAEMAKDDDEAANTEYREDIRKLKAENERLVKCCKEYDSRQRIDENKKFNAIQQLRKMKRTLWISRAAYAKFWANYWFDVAPLKHIKYDRIGRMEGVEKEAILTKVTKHLTASGWVGLWEKVEQLCIKKADEYK